MRAWNGLVVKAAVWSACALLGGCGSTQLTPVGAPQPPRADDCDFQIFTTAPTQGYAEVGTIDVQFGAYGSNTFFQLAEFKQEIKRYVCRAGGDAAIAVANGRGMYIKATVLKAVAPGTPATTASAQVTSPPAAQPQASADPACHYDTQCKGNRICVKGECAEPPEAVPSTVGTTPAAPRTP